MTFEPLAERLRPKSLDEYIGQKHLVGEGCILRKMIESGHISSFILWGPPGVGKTTLAKIIASQVQAPFYTLSAVHSGVKDVRDVLTLCKRDASSMFSQHRPILSSTKSTASTSRNRTRCLPPWKQAQPR